MTDSYFVKSLDVDQMWGERDYSIIFRNDLNILIGRNGSGKTTLLNLLRYILTADIASLLEMNFKRAEVVLESFSSSSKKTIRVTPREDGIRYQISRRVFDLELSPMAVRRLAQLGPKYDHRIPFKIRELQELVSPLVPASWLPVSRRLPFGDDEDDEYYPRRPRKDRLESVDRRVTELLGELVRYRLQLDKTLSDRYKDFEKQVLQLILYSAEQDTVGQLEVPTAEEKAQLSRAFAEAGLLDRNMSKRIDQHFEAAEEAIRRIQQTEAKDPLQMEDVFIIPLINRTKAMVRYAIELEKDRDDLFEPLRRYESIVTSFLQDKSVEVDEAGNLVVKNRSSSGGSVLAPARLSSGEKQLLILLTQALLHERSPVVYVADEPELSLHVTWQENLLSSLMDLGGQMQIIVATHSPDIVSKFTENVVDLDRLEAKG